MKKYIIVFILLSIGATIYLLCPFNSKTNFVSNDLAHFVSIRENKFSLNNAPFYPVAINYIVSLRSDMKEFWPCQSPAYNTKIKYRYAAKDSCLMQLKADMDLIKELGFNSVRIVGIGEESIDDNQTGELSVHADMLNHQDTSIEFSNEENYIKYFNALGELLGVVNKAGLKAVLLTRMSLDVKSTEDHLRKLAIHFKNDTTIMAYDLFNEPLYFDEVERDKKDVYKIVKRWKNMMNASAPNQLVTIGLSGIREVFEWDPGMLDVDFISLHPYEYEPEQVRNEIYWYGHYIKKPWIIGETAIPADNDSISYEEQKSFAHKTLKQAYDCGAVGYSWWQYKDVEWHAYHANFMGVLNQKGETKTIKENLVIEGTPKPLIEEFRKFNPKAKKDSCICLSNYYNYSQYKTFRIIGRLLDGNNNPIQGGVILAWNQYWSHSYHTITKADGSFELTGNFIFYHWMASASLFSMVRGDILPAAAKTGIDKIPTIDVGNLNVNKLSFVN